MSKDSEKTDSAREFSRVHHGELMHKVLKFKFVNELNLESTKLVK